VWPFAYWVEVAEDHFSRRVQGFAAFFTQPTSKQICAFLVRSIRTIGEAPKYVICDRGPQFDCDEFRAWCKRQHGPDGKRHEITPRYGAVGKYGSIAVIERFNRTLKAECTRRITVPLRKREFERAVSSYLEWHAEHRPHMALGGRTPNEAPRVETRRKYPRDAWVASPQAPVKGRRGRRVDIAVAYFKGRQHLPVVTLTPAA
jgi:transposase InsO family protein